MQKVFCNDIFFNYLNMSNLKIENVMKFCKNVMIIICKQVKFEFNLQQKSHQIIFLKKWFLVHKK